MASKLKIDKLPQDVPTYKPWKWRVFLPDEYTFENMDMFMEWANTEFGPQYQPTSRWGCGNVAFYFKEKDDATLFVKTFQTYLTLSESC